MCVCVSLSLSLSPPSPALTSLQSYLFGLLMQVALQNGPKSRQCLVEALRVPNQGTPATIHNPTLWGVPSCGGLPTEVILR